MKTDTHPIATSVSPAPAQADGLRCKLQPGDFRCRRLAGLCLAVGLALTAFLARAATISWTNTSGGNWSAPANWSPNQVPGPADDVLVTQPGSYSVTLDTNATITSLALGAGSGQQRLTNYSNSLTISESASIASNGALDLAGGSLVGTAWQVNANGTFNWCAGSLDKALTVGAGGVLNLSGTTQKELYQPLTNWGTVNWLGGELRLLNSYGWEGPVIYHAVIYNQPGALFDAQCDANCSVGWGRPFIVNAGTFRKSAGSGSTQIQMPFHNTGTVEARSGTLDLSGDGTLGGNYSAAAGSTLQLSGAWVQSGSPAFAGAGQKKFTGGTLTLTTDVVPGLTLESGYLALAQTFQGGSITNLTLAGMRLEGANTVSGLFNWLSGDIGGPLTVADGGVVNLGGTAMKSTDFPLTVATGGVLNLGGTGKWVVRQALTNRGTIHWTSGGLELWNYSPYSFAGAIYNEPGALFEVQCDQALARGYGSELFVNAGTFRKSAAAGTTPVLVWFNNTGTVEARSGTLQFAAGGNLGGTFSAEAGAAVQFNGGTFTLDETFDRAGAGEMGFTGGNIRFTAPITDFDLAAGATIVGTNLLTGTLNWTDGAIVGPLTVASNGVLNLSGSGTKLITQPLTNWGTIHWTSGGLEVRNYSPNSYAGAIYNEPGALFDLQCDQALARYWGLELFANAGTFRKSAAGGTTTVQTRFENTGTVLAQSGTLSWQGVYTQTDGLTLLTNGNLTATYPLRIEGGMLAGTGTIAGSVTNNGVVSPGGRPGRLIITGEYTQTSNGVLNIDLAGLALATGYDRLEANTAARLAGTLNVSLANGFYPPPSTLFAFLATPTRTGTFATFNYPSNEVGLLVDYNGISAFAWVMNVRPELAAIPDAFANELELWTQSVNATDADRPAQTLRFALIDAPPNASIDPSSGRISWTPTEEQGPATTSLTVLVTDNGTPNLTVSRTIHVTVNEVNAAPVLLPVAPQAVNEGETLSVACLATDVDLPANTLSYRLLDPPGGASVDASGVVVWTPTEEQGPGFYTLTVVVSDSSPGAVNAVSMSGTNRISVTVGDVNRAPWIEALPNQQVGPGQTLRIPVAASDPDVPANALTFALLSAPPKAAVDLSSGVFAWRPGAADAATTNEVRLRVTDDGEPALTATQTFLVLVLPLAEVRLTPVLADAERFVFELSGEAGPDYTARVSTNLGGGEWTALLTTNLTSSTTRVTNEFPTAVVERFYRVLIGP